jgi:hypothetical protein
MLSDSSSLPLSPMAPHLSTLRHVSSAHLLFCRPLGADIVLNFESSLCVVFYCVRLLSLIYDACVSDPWSPVSRQTELKSPGHPRPVYSCRLMGVNEERKRRKRRKKGAEGTNPARFQDRAEGTRFEATQENKTKKKRGRDWTNYLINVRTP